MLRLVGFAVALLLAANAPASGRVGGGSLPATDCFAEFDGITETTPGVVVCADGDPCDGDGTANGACEFRITVCAFQLDRPACTPVPIRRFDRNGRHLAVPPVPVTEPRCGATTSVRVPLRGKGTRQRASRKVLVGLRARAIGSPAADVNRFELHCVPPGQGPTTSSVSTSSTSTSTTSTSTSLTTSTTAPMICDPQCWRDSAGPAQLDLTVTTGSDLDVGWTGTYHDFQLPAGNTFRFCVSGCDATTNPVCRLSGSTAVGAECSLNGPTFGPPAPLIAGGVPVCVVNKFSQGAITGEANLATGQISAHVDLVTEVWTSSSATKVCPRCSGAVIGASGTCDSGSRKNQACWTEGVVTVSSNNPPIASDVYELSSDCLPGDLAHQLVSRLPVVLDPLTTETTSLVGPRPCPGQTLDDACGDAACVESCPAVPPLKGGVHQFCCDDARQSPCFPTKTGSIVRVGQREVPEPAWPDPGYPKVGVGSADGAHLAGTYCMGQTFSTVDRVSGLPGPGAIVLPVRQCWSQLGRTCP